MQIKHANYAKKNNSIVIQEKASQKPSMQNNLNIHRQEPGFSSWNYYIHIPELSMQSHSHAKNFFCVKREWFIWIQRKFQDVEDIHHPKKSQAKLCKQKLTRNSLETNYKIL